MSQTQINSEKSRGNYFKAMDGKIYDLFISLGDHDLGDFDPTGGTFKGERYELGEIPLQVVGAAINYKMTSGKARTRLDQLAQVGNVTWRKTGKGKPSFLSLIIEDHDEYFRRALTSRIEYVKATNSNFYVPSADVVKRLDVDTRYTDDPARRRALCDSLRAKGRDVDMDAVWQQYLKVRAQIQADATDLDHLLGGTR